MTLLQWLGVFSLVLGVVLLSVGEHRPEPSRLEFHMRPGEHFGRSIIIGRTALWNVLIGRDAPRVTVNIGSSVVVKRQKKNGS